jgi:hypothetical protein
VTNDEVCARFGLTPQPPTPGTKVGISASALAGETPLHGLRHPPERETNGWYIWSGNLSDNDDFFKPLHFEHLLRDRPELGPYLSLPPGWRFLLAPGHEDVWMDPALLITAGRSSD